LESPSSTPGVDDHNEARLESPSKKWGRFNITLLYMTEIVPPTAPVSTSRKRSAPSPASSSRTSQQRRLSGTRRSSGTGQSSNAVNTEATRAGAGGVGHQGHVRHIIDDPEYIKLAHDLKGVPGDIIIAEKLKIKLGRTQRTNHLSLHTLATELLCDFRGVADACARKVPRNSFLMMFIVAGLGIKSRRGWREAFFSPTKTTSSSCDVEFPGLTIGLRSDIGGEESFLEVGMLEGKGQASYALPATVHEGFIYIMHVRIAPRQWIRGLETGGLVGYGLFRRYGRKQPGLRIHDLFRPTF